MDFMAGGKTCRTNHRSPPMTTLSNSNEFTRNLIGLFAALPLTALVLAAAAGTITLIG